MFRSHDSNPDSNKVFKSDPMRDHLNLFSNRQQPKKKRKSRTAFTNHQIFELEKRFLYQKYLAPADRDEISQSLGLTNAQVITWFQNRRAKLKRDMDELKKDVSAAQVTVSRSILDTFHDYSKATDGLKKDGNSGPVAVSRSILETFHEYSSAEGQNRCDTPSSQ